MAASVPPQPFEPLKEVVFAPVMVTPEMVSVTDPELVTVTDLVAEDAPTLVVGKARLVGEMLMAGVLPVPLSAAVCGELAALSTKLIAAVSAPAAAGVKVTVTAQEALTASVDPQVLVCENEEAFAPVMLMPETDIEAVPEFVSVTICVAGEELTAVEGNVRLVGERLATDAGETAELPGQPFTTLATLIEPRPVALS